MSLLLFDKCRRENENSNTVSLHLRFSTNNNKMKLVILGSIELMQIFFELFLWSLLMKLCSCASRVGRLPSPLSTIALVRMTHTIGKREGKGRKDRWSDGVADGKYKRNSD